MRDIVSLACYIPLHSHPESTEAPGCTQPSPYPERSMKTASARHILVDTAAIIQRTIDGAPRDTGDLGYFFY